MAAVLLAAQFAQLPCGVRSYAIPLNDSADLVSTSCTLHNHKYVNLPWIHEQFCGEVLQRPWKWRAHSVALGVKISTSCSKSPESARTHSSGFACCLSRVMRSGTFSGSSGPSMRLVQCVLFNARITVADPWEPSECGSWCCNSEARWRQQCRSCWAPTAQSCAVVSSKPRSGCPCSLDSTIQQTCLD